MGNGPESLTLPPYRGLERPMNSADFFSRYLHPSAGLLDAPDTDLPTMDDLRISAASFRESSHDRNSNMNSVLQYLLPEDIALDLEVANKRQLFHAIGQHMRREHALSADEVVLSLSRREQAGSTGLGEGVAIPHARVEGLKRIYAFYAHLKSPIPYDSPDGKPVSDVLTLLVPKPATEEHLTILADATQLLSDRRFRNQLHASASPHDAIELFRKAASASPASH